MLRDAQSLQIIHNHTKQLSKDFLALNSKFILNSIKISAAIPLKIMLPRDSNSAQINQQQHQQQPTMSTIDFNATIATRTLIIII